MLVRFVSLSASSCHLVKLRPTSTIFSFSALSAPVNSTEDKKVTKRQSEEDAADDGSQGVDDGAQGVNEDQSGQADQGSGPVLEQGTQDSASNTVVNVQNVQAPLPPRTQNIVQSSLAKAAILQQRARDRLAELGFA